jgi:hypothetical protein
MDLSILKVLKRLNDRQEFPLDQRLFALDDSKKAAVIILDQTLARRCLKHPDVAPYDLWGFYQKVVRLSDRELPHIGAYFATGPLLKHGLTHRDKRRDLAPLYRHLEASIGAWAEDLATQTVTQCRRRQSVDEHPAYQIAADYADRVFLRLISDATGVPEVLIPKMPGRLFELVPRERNLRAREQELAEFVFGLNKEMALRRNPADWQHCAIADILTLILMGHDATKGAIFFGLSQGIMPKYDEAVGWARAVEAWFQDIAPVGVLLRVVMEDCEIDGIPFFKDQTIYVCPHILHEITRNREGRDQQSNSSFAFGSGPHMCPGRALSLKAAEALFKVLAEFGWSSVNLPVTQWRRDLLLIERTTR